MLGISAGQTTDLHISKTTQRQRHWKTKADLSANSPIEETLNQLPSPLSAFTQLHLDLSHTGTHTPIGGRLLLFSHNWEILTSDSWVLTAVRGYHVPLSYWPRCSSSPVNLALDTEKVEALTEDISNLDGKGAGNPVKSHQVHLTSPLFVVQKSRGGWCPIIDLWSLNQCLNPPHFKMEGLYMLPSLLQQRAFLVKVN